MSNKMLIVTVYNSENCGSFLQAYALKVALERCGCEAAFYKRDTQGTSHAFWPHVKLALKRLLHGQKKAVKFTMEPWRAFDRAVKKLPVYNEKSAFYKEAGTVVLGSDTIWNFMDSYFANKSDVFLGTVFGGKRILTYAASAANTDQATFDKVVKYRGGMGHIARLLVRDEHTRDLVEAQTGQKAELVCDPTFLIDRNDYLKLIPNTTTDFRYILLYYFGEIEASLQAGIQEYAAAHGLKIVSLLKDRAWCDYSIPADPMSMLQYFNSASAVVTNTFHGCAFSMIFERPFAAHDVGKIKVRDLLTSLGEENRLFTDSQGMKQALATVCEVVISGRLDAYRSASMEILQDSVRMEQ